MEDAEVRVTEVKTADAGTAADCVSGAEVKLAEGRLPPATGAVAGADDEDDEDAVTTTGVAEDNDDDDDDEEEDVDDAVVAEAVVAPEEEEVTAAGAGVLDGEIGGECL
jgi:hypothetical protein